MNNFTIDNYDKLKKIANFIGNPSELVTEDKTIVGAINEISEGGSGGDLTTAVLTINNSDSGAEVNISICNVIDTVEVSGAVPSLYVDAGETIEAPIILYKGMALAIDWTEGAIPSYSGNIVAIDNNYQITGNCTITYVDE